MAVRIRRTCHREALSRNRYRSVLKSCERDALLRQRSSARNKLTKSAIDLWIDRKNDPYWQLHTMNLDAGFIEGPLRVGMVIDFEPIVSIDDLGFYLEDMFLITKTGAEDLTPKVPFTSDEIEVAMRK